MEKGASADNLNEIRLKKILINFEKKASENQKLRIKHGENPTKFAASETELFAALDELQSVAIQPELYHVLISKKTLTTLMALLMHENTDISAKVIGMLQEFTDIDEANEQESTEALIESLVGENVVDLIVSNLGRLDEEIKDEAHSINNSLAIIDNLIDFDAKLATTGSKPLIDWMMEQLSKTPEFNTIKLSISELLSVLLMNDKENKIHLGKANGIDVLLQQVAYYMRVAPVTGAEHEFLEQIINCLCTAILDCDQNRESFYKEEGVDLVQLILREKRDSIRESNIKLSALKLFNHVLTTDKNQDSIVTKCCERFIQVLGLKVLFPIFNNPKLALSKRVKKREYHHVLDEIEEHTAAILLALLKYCQNTDLIQRVLVKFAESNFEKLNRLITMHDKYFRLVSSQHKNAIDSDNSDGGENESLNKSSFYFILRTIDYVILLSCYLGNHFETYDPNSGETFTNMIKKLLACRPELRNQIVQEVGKHIDEVADSQEEQNSLELLIKYFEQLICIGNKEINQ